MSIVSYLPTVSASVFNVSQLFALIAACPARWSAVRSSYSSGDWLEFYYDGVEQFSIGADADDLDNLLDVRELEDLSTLSVFPAECWCYGCACEDEEEALECSGYGCAPASAGPCSRCDSEAAPFQFVGAVDDDGYTIAYDFADALDLARRYAVGVSYEVAPLVGSIILDAFRSSPSWVGGWIGDDAKAATFTRGAFSVDLADLSRVVFFDCVGVYSLEFDSGADLMDADTLAAFLDWVTGSTFRACPLAVMHRIAA